MGKPCVAIEEAIKHLVDFRKQEGAALEKKFHEKIANISHLLESLLHTKKNALRRSRNVLQTPSKNSKRGL